MKFLNVKFGSSDSSDGEIAEPPASLGSERIGQTSAQRDFVVPDQIASVLPDLDVINKALLAVRVSWTHRISESMTRTLEQCREWRH